MFAGEIGDIGFPPRALEHYTAALEATRRRRGASRGAGFKVVLDYALRRRRRSSCRTCWPSSAPTCSAVNPYASTAGRHRRSTAAEHAEQVADLVRASGAHLGAVIDPDGEHLTLIDDEGHVLDRHRGAAGAASPCVGGHLLGDRVALPGQRHRATPSDLAAAPRRAGPAHEAVDRRRSWTPRPSRASGFAASQDGGFILPGFLPAFDAAATLVKLLDLLARTRPRALRRWSTSLPRTAHRPRDRGDPVGAEGHRHAHARRA